MAVMASSYHEPTQLVVPSIKFNDIPRIKLEVAGLLIRRVVILLLPIFIWLYSEFNNHEISWPSPLSIVLTIDCYLIQFQYYLSLGFLCFIVQLLTGDVRVTGGGVS